MADLKGKVALITGASRGIGRAIALAYAGAGASVAVTARSAEQLDALVAGVVADGGEALAIPADLTVEADIQRIAEKFRRKPPRSPRLRGVLLGFLQWSHPLFS